MSGIKKLSLLAFSFPFLAAPFLRAAEFEALDRFSVDGYTVLRGSADIPGGLFTVGTSTFVVKGGNVGIGTTEPGTKLEVRGIAGVASLNVNYDLGGASGNGIVNGGTNLYLRPQAGAIYNDAGPTYLTGGNVGIGTTNPRALLSLGNNLGAILVRDYYHIPSGSYYFSGITAEGFNTNILVDSDHSIIFGSNAPATATPALGTEYMRINNSGNVGIGTTAPGYKLDVTAEARVMGGFRLGNGADAGNENDPSVTSSGYTHAGVYFANNGVGLGAGNGKMLFLNSSGSVGIGTTSPAATFDVGGTGSIKIPVGSTGERPGSPVNGMMRINTTTGRLEYYYGSGWNSVGAVAATGGTITEVGGYRIHTFTGNGTFTVTTGGNIDVLIVAGGGGTGYTMYHNGGGGGGGLVYATQYAVPAGAYSITVGAGGLGGAGAGSGGGNGGDSTAFGFIAKGGGGGSGYVGVSAQAGGSGGGGMGNGGDEYGKSSTQNTYSGTPNVTGYGNPGGNGAKGQANAYGPGGGGGAGGAGGNGTSLRGGYGGAGKDFSSVFGTAVGASGWFAGGGGGGAMDGGDGTGGSGGGGTGNMGAGNPGQANTGGGAGGGERLVSQAGQPGGSGVVIIRCSN